MPRRTVLAHRWLQVEFFFAFFANRFTFNAPCFASLLHMYRLAFRPSGCQCFLYRNPREFNRTFQIRWKQDRLSSTAAHQNKHEYSHPHLLSQRPTLSACIHHSCDDEVAPAFSLEYTSDNVCSDSGLGMRTGGARWSFSGRYVTGDVGMQCRVIATKPGIVMLGDLNRISV